MWVHTAIQMESQNGQGGRGAFKQLALSRVSAVLVLGVSMVGARVITQQAVVQDSDNYREA